MVDGHEAVLTFFAISGFHMALILDTKYDGKRQFYLNRFLSLYPMYVFALSMAVALIVTADIHPMTTREGLQELISNPLGFVLMVWTSVCVFGLELLFSFARTTDGGLYFMKQAVMAFGSMPHSSRLGRFP